MAVWEDPLVKDSRKDPSLGEGNGNPFRYSCLGNPMDGGASGLQSIGLQRIAQDLAIKQQYSN